MESPTGRGNRPIARRGGQATRERILAAGLEEFAERGFDGTTTRAIAARAETNLGLIKYYFGNKEELWRAAVDRAFDEITRTVLALDATALGDVARLAEAVRAAVRFAARNPAFIRLMNDECKRDSDRMRWLTDRHGRRLYEAAVAALETARSQRVVPDLAPVHLFYMLVGAVGMIFSQAPECARLTGVDPTKSETMIEAHADAIVKLFLEATS